MQGQIDAAAAKERAKQLLRVSGPKLHPLLMRVCDELSSPMMTMTVKGIAMMLPDPGREAFSGLLTSLIGLKGSSLAEVQGKADAAIDSIPDEVLGRWGGVLAWVLTGT